MKRARGVLKVIAALCIAAAPVFAAAPENPFYFDGSTKITVTADPTLVAEFAKPGAKSAVLAARPKAPELKTGSGGPRVFRAPSASFKPRTETGSSTSPVFRLGTSPAGRLMALPGGMVVTFKPEWNDSQIRAWANAKGTPVDQRLNIKGNWYVLRTEPGLVALETANAVHASGEVLAASPNWWKETVTR